MGITPDAGCGTSVFGSNDALSNDRNEGADLPSRRKTIDSSLRAKSSLKTHPRQSSQRLKGAVLRERGARLVAGMFTFWAKKIA
ncbi:hypothetical protein GHK30_03830 [Sinorhizobium medicae]|nr:hypothetical protein [Sinorhizobium medicae]